MTTSVDLGDLLIGLKVDKTDLKNFRKELSDLAKGKETLKLAMDSSDITKATEALKGNTTALKNNEKASRNSEKQSSKFHKTNSKTSDTQNLLNDQLNNTAKTLQLIQGPLGGAASRFVTFKSIISTNTVAVAGFSIAIAGLVQVFSSATRGFIQTEAALNKFDNIITSTGRNFETTIQDMDKVAENLARRTLLGLEEARDGIGAALTFTNIPTDQIERFGDVVADVAAGLNNDFKGSISAVGKAIQAPASALDGLGRAGIFFTKSQREQLQLMVDTGRAAESTEIILSKLEERFKNAGSARGLSGALDTLEIDLKKFREGMLIGSGASNQLTIIVEKASAALAAFSKEGGLAETLGRLLARTLAGISKGLTFLEDNMASVVTVMKTLLSLFAGQAIFRVAEGFKGLVLASGALTGPLTALTIGFKGLARAVNFFTPLALVKGLEMINEALLGQREGISAFQLLWVSAKATVKVAIVEIINTFNTLLDSVSHIFGGMRGDIDKSFNLTMKDAVTFGADFINSLTNVFKAIGAVIGTTVGVWVTTIKDAFDGIIMLGSAAGDAFSGEFEMAAQKSREALKSIAGINPFVVLSKSAREAGEAASEALNSEGIIDKQGLIKALEESGTEGAIEFTKAFLTKVTGKFGENVRQEIEKEIAQIQLDLGVKKVKAELKGASKEVRDLVSFAGTLSFDRGLSDLEKISGKLRGYQDQLAKLNAMTLTPDLEAQFAAAGTTFEETKSRIIDGIKEVKKEQDSAFNKVFDSTGLYSALENVRLLEEELARVVKDPNITITQIELAEKAIQDARQAAFDIANPFVAEFTKSWDQFTGQASQQLAEKLMGGDTNFKDLAKTWVTGLLGNILQQLLFNPLANQIQKQMTSLMNPETGQMTFKGGNTGGSGFESLAGLFGNFQGFFANGGNVAGNRPAIVGEKGPEMFIPRTAGQIVNAGDTRSIMNNSNTDSRSVVININSNSASEGLQVARSRAKSVAEQVFRNS